MLIRNAWLGLQSFVQFLYRRSIPVKNRRMFPRVPAKHLLRIVSCENLSNALCNLIDISEGGLKFTAPQKPRPGSSVQMFVNLLEESKNLFLSGEIVWARPSGDHAYHIGVRFTDVGFHELESVRNFVAFSLLKPETLQG